MVKFGGPPEAGGRSGALGGVPAALWQEVARAPHSLLMLDYDGTLAPFTADRDESWAPARTLETLRRLAAGTRTTVAIVSGRPMRELVRFLGDLPVTLIGEHGWERRTPEGRIVEARLDESLEPALDGAERVARALGWGDWLERKRASVVLHTRRLPPARAENLQEACTSAWRCLAHGVPVTVDRIDGGVEFRANANNKGDVVRALLSGSSSETLGVFVGDDATDEDAFDAVRTSGFGVRVGDARRPSRATGHLPDPQAVTLFLERWLRTIESGTSPS